MSARRRVALALSVLVCFGVILLLGSSGVAQQPPGRPQADDSTTDSEGKPLPGTTIPCAPIAEKRQELGCYVIARQRLGVLPLGTPRVLEPSGGRSGKRSACYHRGSVRPHMAVHDSAPGLATRRGRRARGDGRPIAAGLGTGRVHRHVLGDHLPAGALQLRALASRTGSVVHYERGAVSRDARRRHARAGRRQAGGTRESPNDSSCHGNGDPPQLRPRPTRSDEAGDCTGGQLDTEGLVQVKRRVADSGRSAPYTWSADAP